MNYQHHHYEAIREAAGARIRTYPGEFVGLLHIGEELHLDVAQVEHLRLPLIHRLLKDYNLVKA